ncbi:MAG: ABC transporter substrate-binding protein [Verrucomicrobiota bacterium]|nr:ABC transporter substrate-binding protein [Verrucomicrobiota bacterium]
MLLTSLFAFAVRAGGETVFRRSMDRVASMDPADASSTYAARAAQLVYEPLLEFDYRARPYRLIPGLAESLPEVQSNGLVYVLRLDPEARFQADPCFGTDGEGRPRGRPVTAEDVVFSLKRLADRRVASPGEWLVLDTVVGMRAFSEASMSGAATDYARPVGGLEAVDARTVRITLTRLTHQFPWFLAMCFTAVVPREAVERYGSDFGSHAVGTGPYRLKEWRRNHQMTFERDPAWRGWRRGPAAARAGDAAVPFDRVVYSVIDDVSTQWLCFLSGEMDFLGAVARDNWDAVIDGAGGLNEGLRRRGVALHALPTLEVAYIGINMDDPVLGPNRALRQALNCAFDSAAWTRFFNQRTVACDGPVPPGTEGRLETPFPYAHDLGKARALMAEAGYPGGIDPKTGKRLELAVDMGRTSQDIRESTELLVSFFAQAGVSLKVQYHNWPTFLRRVSNRQSQMFRIGWVGDYPDAENFLQLFYGKNVAPGPNRSNYANPAFDRLYEAACATPDAAERNRIWARAQELVREDCPWVFLHFQKDYSLSHARVLDYVPSDFPHGSEKYLRTPATPTF